MTKKLKLKVLHVIPSIAPCRGGPSKAVIEMVSALRKIGIDAEIATTNDDGPQKLNVELNSLIEHNGVPIRFFNRVSPSINALREFTYSFSFARWLGNNIAHYDLIHVHAIFSYCSTKAMSVARKLQVPYVVRPIGQLENWALSQSASRKKYYLKIIEQRNLEGAACVQFTAESEKTQALETLPNLKASVIPLGIELPMLIRDASRKMIERWQLKDGIPTIVYLSRIHPKKGLDILLKALAQLGDIEYQFVIAGDGDSDHIQTLERLTGELNIEAQCHFVGFVHGIEKQTLLQGADLFALTSHSENFGIAVIEALASGTPALISREVALSEQVAKEQIGYVADLNDQTLVELLADALSDLERLTQMGDKARRYVEQSYQWPAIARQLSGIYSNISKT